MKRHAWTLYSLTLLLLSPGLQAQSVTTPALHHRGDPSTTDHPVELRM